MVPLARGALSVTLPANMRLDDSRPRLAHVRTTGNPTQVLASGSQVGFGFSASAIRTRSASVRVPIFRIAAAR
jgi:hypothetical protein